MNTRSLLLASAALAALGAGAGCGGDATSIASEQDDSSYRDGQQMERQGRWDEALSDYLKVIDRRGETAPESNLDAGLIYLYHIKDPVFAIYHFRRYLELEPNSKQAVYVRGLMDAAKREFARSLPGQPMENQTAQLGIEEQVTRLQRENDELRAENAAFRAGGPAPVLHSSAIDVGAAAQGAADGDAPAAAAVSPITLAPAEAAAAQPSAITDAPEAAAAPAAPPRAPAASAKSGRHHVVVKGDTLFSLAQRYYGSRSRWRDILAANHDLLPTDKAPLKIGMDVRIP
ncbi:MAG TPA: LysM peptidoglycan-binding domain-containing protein [Opitutaceae bacterium]|jgi:LysM repeat protein